VTGVISKIEGTKGFCISIRFCTSSGNTIAIKAIIIKKLKTKTKQRRSQTTSESE
jgi:hypothetical protein